MDKPEIIECEYASTYRVSALMLKFDITKEQARALKDTGCVEIKPQPKAKKKKEIK